MQSWLCNIRPGIESAAENYFKSEREKFPDTADYSEYSYIYDIAEEEIPRIVHGSFVVSIVALLEASLEKLLCFCAKQERAVPLDKYLEKNRARLGRCSVIDKFINYQSEVLGLTHKYDTQDIAGIKDLILLRNHIAHGNGLMCEYDFSRDDSKSKLKPIVEASDETLLLSVGQLTVTNQYLLNSFQIVNRFLKELMLSIEDRYFME